MTAFEARPRCGRPPGSGEADQACAELVRLRGHGLVTAPSIKTPALEYFLIATTSLRASAEAAPFCATRSLNQRLSVDDGWCLSQSQAISSRVDRRRGSRICRCPVPDQSNLSAEALVPNLHTQKPAAGCRSPGTDPRPTAQRRTRARCRRP